MYNCYTINYLIQQEGEYRGISLSIAGPRRGRVNGLLPIFKWDATTFDYAFEGAKWKVSSLMEWHNDLFIRLRIPPFLVASLASDMHKPTMPKHTDNFIWFKAWIFRTQR